MGARIRDRAASRRVAAAALVAAVGAIVVPTLTATSASAATGTFEDELGDAYSYSFPSSVNPEADIDRAELRLDGEVVQVRVYLDAVSPAYDDQTTISAYLETDDATYDMNRVPAGADPSTSGFQDGLQVLSTQPGGGMLWQPVPDCPVRSVLSSAARSVTLSVDARCVGDPARARTIVTVVNDYGGNRVAQDWAPVDNAQLSSWVDAGPSGANLPIAPVYRFWSPGFQNAHFFTTNVDEASRLIDGDPNWLFEGAAFEAFVADGPTCTEGTDEVYRFYSARFQSHFFTIDEAEKTHIVTSDRNWTDEGIAYCAQQTEEPGTIPLYRFWSPRYGKHHFTVDPAEAHQLDVSDPAWDAEGIAYYLPAY